MKQCIKMISLMLLILLLHASATEGESNGCACPADASEQCSLSQAPTMQQLLDDFYKYISSHTNALNMTDSAQSFKSKYMRLPATRAKLLRAPLAQQGYACTILPCPPPSDPLGYYIYGLRKILC
ncbi:MAG: hypothetical protein IJ511_09185 [Bacteroides sp.]|nr:hypothetical protein [Bacteroides sp.]